MKRIITAVFFMLIANLSWCQSNPIEPSNNTIIRLTILNDAGEMLIRDTPYGWMTPAAYHNEREDINEVIERLVQSYGIKISKVNLAGIFNYKYEFKTTADIRLLYIAKQIGGNLHPEVENEKLHWVSKKDGIEKLSSTVPSLGEMTKQILDYPQIIWGGSYTLSRDDENKLKSEMTESFYPIHGNR